MVKLIFKMQSKYGLALLFAAGTVWAQPPLKQDPKDVIAVVDGRDVTRGEIQQIMYTVGPAFTTAFQANPQVALFNYFVKQELGKQGAAMKLDEKSPLKERMEAMRMEFLADERMNIEMNAYQVPAVDIQKFYNQNANRFQRVKVSGIFVKFKPKDNQGTGTADLAAAAAAILSAGQLQRTEEEARAIAADLTKRLRAGEDMAKLANQYSEDVTSKATGGEIGFVNPTSGYPAEFIAGAMTLAKGSVSDPIRLAAGSGFYVLRADDRSVVPLNEASADIETELKKAHLNDFLESLNKRYRPTMKDPALILQMIQATPAQPGTQR
jgi:parvulin-like peptidyl-prolyl isomerase